ncbi:MAG: hypothetical protein JWN89_456 [Parcubacteria group bacterium]|nr:hypothetical protein [Parcubacteria group bacterium]
MENPIQDPPVNFEAEIEQERVRIYDRPEADPAIQALEAEILMKTNTDPAVQNSQRSGMDSGNTMWNRVNFRVTMHSYNKFVSAYPEKAAAYASSNKEIQAALERKG